MSSEPQLFRINPETHDSKSIREVEFTEMGFKERDDIQEWIVKNPDILGEELLMVGKEFSGFDRTNERLDLLAVDKEGRLVVIELKRDHSGADVHWQAIKYASYVHRATRDQIVRMFAEHEGISFEVAQGRLKQFLGTDDLNGLNNNQRIILASHRFAREVTSAVLWLNERAGGANLISCVQLTPYRDAANDSLYVQANRIIPVPGTEEYVIGVGDSPSGERSVGGSLAQTHARNSSDAVTRFLREVADLTVQELSNSLRPDKRSRWAGEFWKLPNWKWRYYHLWYSRPPWGNWDMSYRVNLWRTDEDPALSGSDTQYRANVEFRDDKNALTEKARDKINAHFTDLDLTRGVTAVFGFDALDSTNARTIADTLRRLIEAITPIVDDPENESNEADIPQE